MRRIGIIFLVFIVLSTQFSQTVFSNENELSFEEFSSLVSAMTKKYNLKETTAKSSGLDGIVIENRLIIKTFSNVPLNDDRGAIEKIEGYDFLHILQFSCEEDTQYAFDFFETQSNVDYVEYDFSYNINMYSDITDSLFVLEKNQSWGPNKVNSPYIISKLNALNIDFPEVVVAVIDSGIDYNHPIFDGRIIDSSCDYVENDQNPSDDFGHGTLVSGVIVNNTTENVKIKPYKTINYLGNGDYLNTCIAIEKAVIDNVKVINISSSWIYTNNRNITFYNSIYNANRCNIPVVVSAGNYMLNANLFCPARSVDVITVAATNINNRNWWKSNYGECVDIAAPGSNIYTTERNGGFSYESGTSVAAPFVSAAAAILKTVIPGITNQQIKDRLKNTAYVPPGWDTNYGAGIVDFKAMLADQMTSPPTINVIGNSATITAEPDATIYYTTNGTDPTVESTVYTGAFSTSNIKEIRAIAFKSGLLPSETAVHTFKWKIDVDVTVNKTAKIDFPEGMSPLYIENRNPEIAVLSTDGTVEGVEIGDAVCVAYFGNNHSAVYHIHVDYNWFVRLIRKLFAWLFWIIDLFRLS